MLEESLALSASLAQDQQLAAEPPSVLSPSRFLQLASQPTEERYSTAHSGPPVSSRADLWGARSAEKCYTFRSILLPRFQTA